MPRSKEEETRLLLNFLLDLPGCLAGVDKNGSDGISGFFRSAKVLLSEAKSMEPSEIKSIRMLLCAIYDLRAEAAKTPEKPKNDRKNDNRRKVDRFISFASMRRGKGKTRQQVADELAPMLGIGAELGRRYLSEAFPGEEWKDGSAPYTLR